MNGNQAFGISSTDPRVARWLILPFLAWAIVCGSVCDGDEPAAATWDSHSDTWVATDALGRVLPTNAEVGSPMPNRTVGMFYFLWLGRHGERGPFDISKILQAHPDAMTNPSNPMWGPLHAPHHWSEPLFGYYVSDDDAVLRKHAQMLSDAGVDMVVFDVTNQLTYPQSWKALCRVWAEVRRSGNPTPEIAFLCPFGDPNKVVHELWEQLYKPGLYEELWFRWEDKPLILADPARLSHGDGEPIHDFFTFRKPQPDYFAGPTGPEQWGWLEVFPQHVFYASPGVPEQMTVGVAQNAVDGKLSVLSHPRSHGRSFHDAMEPAPDQVDTTGRNFAEQWQRAREVDPPFIFVTGWNEWIAGRFDENAPFHDPGPVAFVDQFDQEFSRDCEPMLGGHGDNYYYQLVDQIRRYKGVRPIAPVLPRKITIDGDLADWVDVQPEFRDTIGDPVDRNHRGWGEGSQYVDETGRNDIIAAKVSFDRDHVYFYVRTREKLTAPNAPHWMQLWIDSDSEAATGWMGYDLVVNRHPLDENTASVERASSDAYQWETAGDATIQVGEREIELSVPRALFPSSQFHFKWTDNVIDTESWTDFTLHGDAAPNDRFNYRAVLGSDE